MIKKKRFIYFFGALAVVSLFYGLYTIRLLNDQALGEQIVNNPTPPSEKALSAQVVNSVELSDDSSSAKVDLDEIVRVLGKDGIPAIDNPLFETVEGASSWMKDVDRVFVLKMDDVVKIYPQKILNWHEIVNDWIYDKPIAVTFCPLCGSSVAFERRVNGTITEFGVSGKLHQNDLVMYDRLEGSLWQQITGEAIVGEASKRNEELNPISLAIYSFDEVSEKYPGAYVLSRNTGFTRNYEVYPYGSYETNSQIGVAPQDVDETLHPKTWIYGVEVDGISTAFVEDDLISKGALAHQNIQATYSDGLVKFVNIETKEEIIPIRLFWFAWAAFHPDTLVVGG